MEVGPVFALRATPRQDAEVGKLEFGTGNALNSEVGKRKGEVGM